MASGVGLVFPRTLLWFNKDCVTAALAITMVCMGLTLTTEDFSAVSKKPGQVLAGVLLQYTIMPTLGLLISRFFGVPAAVATGAKTPLHDAVFAHRDNKTRSVLGLHHHGLLTV